MINPTRMIWWLEYPQLRMIVRFAARRMSRLLETWCLMEYAEKGSLADALRTGRLRRPGGFPELGVIIACLQDIASGTLTILSLLSLRLSKSWLSLGRLKRAGIVAVTDAFLDYAYEAAGHPCLGSVCHCTLINVQSMMHA